MQPDERLDFLSPDFSAEEALQSNPSRIQLPCPEVAPCDNLDQYASLARGVSRTTDTITQQQRERAGDREAPPQQEGARGACQVQRRMVRVVKSVILTMDDPGAGPVSLVQRWRGEGVRVRVVIRHCAGVRGECVGTIIAFDRHFNLVLGDVSERFTPFRTVANGGVHPRPRRRRHKHRDTGSVEQLCRQLDKLFIRGDNIVLLSAALTHSQTTQQSQTEHNKHTPVDT